MRVTVELPEHLTTPVTEAAGDNLAGWLAEAARVRLAADMARGVVELTGPVVRAVLGDADRRAFDFEFRAAVEVTFRDRDVDRIGEVVCLWWLKAGGDPNTVEEHRDNVRRRGGMTSKVWPDGRPVYAPENPVNNTGPDVWAGLNDDQRAEFDTQLRATLAEAARTFDPRGAQQVVSLGWCTAMIRANPAQLHVPSDEMERVKAGTEPTFPALR